jgi:hypothetical protein
VFAGYFWCFVHASTLLSQRTASRYVVGAARHGRVEGFRGKAMGLLAAAQAGYGPLSEGMQATGGTYDGRRQARHDGSSANPGIDRA